MENIEDILAKNKAKKEPFKVPEGYFEDFEARLNARIDALEAEGGKGVKMEAPTPESASEPASESKKNGIWLTLKPLLYVAACIIALYAATYIIVQPKIHQAAVQEANAAEQDSINKMAREYEDFYQYFVEDLDDDDSMIDYLTSNN